MSISRRRTAPSRKPLPLDPEPAATEPAAAAPVPAVTRVCSFCMSHRPLSELGQVAYSLQCLDYEACQERARQSGIYPMPEDDPVITARELRQGALR